MIDDDNPPTQQSGEPDGMLYDWYKHLTSLSLLTLGGVLSLTQGANAGELKKSLLIMVLVFVTASGVLAFSAAAQVVDARTKGIMLPRYAHIVGGAAAMLLAMGVGAFVYVFVRAL